MVVRTQVGNKDADKQSGSINLWWSVRQICRPSELHFQTTFRPARILALREGPVCDYAKDKDLQRDQNQFFERPWIHRLFIMQIKLGDRAKVSGINDAA